MRNRRRRLIIIATVAIATAVGTMPTADGMSRLLFRTQSGAQQVSLPAERAFESKQRLVAAIRQFAEALSGRYGDEKLLVWSALNAMQAALAEWDEALQAHEAAPATLNSDRQVTLGIAHLDRRLLDAAIRDLAEAARLEPDRSSVRAFQGITYEVMDRSAEAARAFGEAARLEPGDPTASYRQARLLTKIGRTADAEVAGRQFRESMQKILDDDRPRGARFIRADLLQQSGGVAPIFLPAAYSEGITALKEGRYQEAVLRFRDAATLDPLSAESRAGTTALLRASAELRQGQLAPAVDYLETAIASEPNVSELHRMLGMAYWADEQYDKSIEQFRGAIRLHPNDERSRVALADVLYVAGRFAEAEQTYREALEAIPGSGQAHYNLARVYDAQSRTSDAIDHFEQAAKLNPLVGLDHLYQTVTRLFLIQPDLDRATEAATKRVDASLNSAEAHQALAEIHLQQGKHDDALTEFLAALLVGGASAESWAGIAQAHLRAARYAEAVEAARRALASNPAQPTAQYALAASLIRLGRSGEGQEAMQRFQQMQAERQARDQRDWELKMLKQEASITLDRGNLATASTLLQKVAEYEPESASAHMNLGLVLRKTGRHREGLEHLKRAAELNAGLEIHRLLAEAYQALGQTNESEAHRAVYQRLKEDRLKKGAWPR